MWRSTRRISKQNSNGKNNHRKFVAHDRILKLFDPAEKIPASKIIELVERNRPHDAVVADQYVETAELFVDRAEHRVDIVGPCEIGLDDAAASAIARRIFGMRFGVGLRAILGDDDRARVGEGPRESRAHVLGHPRDQGDFAVESHHRLTSFSYRGNSFLCADSRHIGSQPARRRAGSRTPARGPSADEMRKRSCLTAPFVVDSITFVSDRVAISFLDRSVYSEVTMRHGHSSTQTMSTTKSLRALEARFRVVLTATN